MKVDILQAVHIVKSSQVVRLAACSVLNKTAFYHPLKVLFLFRLRFKVTMSRRNHLVSEHVKVKVSVHNSHNCFEVSILAHQSKVSFCDHNLSGVPSWDIPSIQLY
jgi:hypothetical protein